MSRDASRSPFVGEGAMLSRKRGASVGSVVNGQTVTESVSKRSCCGHPDLHLAGAGLRRRYFAQAKKLGTAECIDELHRSASG